MDRRKRFAAILAGVMAGIMLLSLLLSLLSSTIHVHAETSEEIKEQIDNLKGEFENGNALLEELEKNLAQNLTEIRDIVSRKNGIDQQIALLHTQIKNVQQQVSAFNLLLADKQEELDLAQERLERLNKEYKNRIRAMEEQGDLSYWSVIFKASSFSDLLDRLNVVAEIASADRRRLEELRDAAQEVASAQERLAADRISLQTTKAELEATQKELEIKRAESDDLLQSLIARGEEYTMLIEETEDAQADLMQTIANRTDDYDKRKYEEWLATSVPPTTTSPGGPGNVVGGVVWYTPTTNYRITSLFGYRTHPIDGQWKMHYGIDMAAPAGTPIYATRTGVVTVATYHWSAGNYVNINHADGYTSIYMHMTHYIVNVGDYVSAGQIIGYVGNTGGSTGNHLHFGIAYNGVYQDPLKYIDA